MIKNRKIWPIVKIQNLLKSIFSPYHQPLWAKIIPKLWKKIIKIRWWTLKSSKDLHYGPISQKVLHRIFSIVANLGIPKLPKFLNLSWHPLVFKLSKDKSEHFQNPQKYLVWNRITLLHFPLKFKHKKNSLFHQQHFSLHTLNLTVWKNRVSVASLNDRLNNGSRIYMKSLISIFFVGWNIERHILLILLDCFERLQIQRMFW
jgi:hypothetical protein